MIKTFLVTDPEEFKVRHGLICCDGDGGGEDGDSGGGGADLLAAAFGACRKPAQPHQCVNFILP